MTAALPEWNGALQPVRREIPPIENIILPLDGTEQARAGIPVAQTLASLYNATMHIVYVGNGELPSKDAARWWGFESGARQPRLVQPGGDPVERIARFMQDLPEAILIVSTELGSRSDRDRFGSMTESLFTSHPARTIVVGADRGQGPWRLRHILLAHDGTPGSRSATDPAIDLALRSKAEVIALHIAARGQERPEEAGSMSAPLYVDQPQHEWPAWAHEFMNRILASGAPASSIRFKLTVSGGQPGSEVAQVARDRDVDLVVMAWHGHWDHENCATRVVIRRSGCPVLLAYSAV